jgi:cell division protein ZapA
MSEVSVTINGRRYQIACDDGQEAHLTRLASYIDQRVAELVAAIGQVGEGRLLVMASLLIADELSDAYSKLEDKGGAPPLGRDPATDEAKLHEKIDEIVAPNLEKLADRLESIAGRLDRT